MRTIAIGLLLAFAATSGADDPKPPKLTPEEQKLEAEAVKLNNEAMQLYQRGQFAEAVVKTRRALEIFQQLYPASKYPDGHVKIGSSLSNLGIVLEAIGQAEKALPLCQQGLEMYRKLFPASKYPDGHPDLAESLNYLGFVLNAMGQAEKALPYYQQSLEMRQKLFPASKYPDGHPELAGSLDDLGAVLDATGQAEKSLPLVQQGLQMHQRLLRRELATASEEAAFDKIASRPLMRDSYLSVTRSLNTSAAECFPAIWLSRSMVTRLLDQRHSNVRAVDTMAGDQLNRLRGNRRRIEELLQDARMDAKERDQLLAKYADERDKLERELVAAIPALKRWQELDKLGPTDLVGALPPGAVFVDLIRYMHFTYEKQKVKRTPCYVAFVLTKSPSPSSRLPRSGGEEGVMVQRIELGEAKPIDDAIAQWRRAIDSRADTPAAEWLRQNVWAKLASAIPSGTKTLYLAPDGDLARLPWAALPLGKDRVLLEEFAIAQVPHGTFLLESLKYPREFSGADRTLLLGGIDYRSEIWPVLNGTRLEINALAALGVGERETASGGDATKERVAKSLPRARYAHLATHGEFKAEELTAEKKRAATALESRLSGEQTRTIAAKNPLGYVGLVLSGGEIMSGLSIVDLDLKNLKLVTLSACETGLGELTAGEGVQGLQSTFHLAGCPNVVASLGKVNDAATAALMAKFYDELWVNKREPLAALRAAQLTIYRHPELIAELSRERGAPKQKEALAVKPLAASQTPARPRAARADTKLWAAFVLSGVGK